MLSRKTRSRLGTGRKPFNPTERERLIKTVKGELKANFDKDLGRLLRTLARYGLREVYMAIPQAVLDERLKYLGDLIPESMREEIRKLCQYDLNKGMGEVEASLNRTLQGPADVLNHFLRPFNREIHKPATTMMNFARRAVIASVMAGRPRLPLRNALQRLLTLMMYPGRDFIGSQFSRIPEPYQTKIKETTYYRLSTMHGWEDFANVLSKLETSGMALYKLSHAGLDFVSNVNVAMGVGFRYARRMKAFCESSEGQEKIRRFAEKRGLSPRQVEKLFWRESDLVDEAVEAGMNSQWLYWTTGLPTVFRGTLPRTLLALQSWWPNYFFNMGREALHRAFHGTTSRGRYIPPQDRFNMLKGFLLILGATEGLRTLLGMSYQRFLLPPGSAPTYMSPSARFVWSTFRFIFSGTGKARRSAWSSMKSSLKAHVPFWLATKEARRLATGDITLKEYLFYGPLRAEKGKSGSTVLGVKI